jgi:hypothetical protein
LKLQKPQLKELIREMVKVDPKKFEHIKHYVENYERLSLYYENISRQNSLMTVTVVSNNPTLNE